MKLTTVTHVSVDGVMQGLGGPDEDRRNGFERGGWAPPLFDNEAATFLGQVYQRADAFLFGRLTDPRWADTTVLSGDFAAAIGELKAQPAGELQVHGSGNLVRWLLDHQLVDEIILLTYPVVIGQGTRLFSDTGLDTALDLVDSRATPTGVTIHIYRPTGRPQYVTATANSST
jgi:RibD C-terminal domain